MNMNKDYKAFLAKASAVSFVYGKKDGEPSMSDVLKAQEKVLTAFEAIKEKNDAMEKEFKEKGSQDTVARDQVERIKTEILGFKDDLEKLMKQMSRPGGGGSKGNDFSSEQMEHKAAFLAFMRDPASEKARADLQAMEAKAVTTTTGASGGYAVPEIISQTIEKNLLEISDLANYVDNQAAGSKDFKVLVDVGGASYGWVGETDARAETDTDGLEEAVPTFGTVYAKPKASEESLSDIFYDVESWIIGSAQDGLAEGVENAIVSGNGTKKPTGILSGTPTAEVDGTRAYGTLQYRATGLGDGFAADNPADVLVKIITDLKKGYRRNARWLMNKATVGDVMLFKDGQGNYLWQPSAQLGQPDRLKGYEVIESEEMPDVAADAFPIAFGDYKAGYLLVPLVGLRITRDEVTEPGYVKWYVRKRIGGNIKKSEAIKLVKIAAA